jgi:ureidoacrylate peracid hydrolase
MSFKAIVPNETGLLFFDFLNAYFRGSNEETQRRMEPVVANCQLLREAVDKAGIPVFHAKADHRTDGLDAARLYSDTDMRLEPWGDPERERFDARHTVAGNSWTGDIIDELAPVDGDYVIPKHRWSAFFQTKLELSLRARGINTLILCGGALEIGIVATSFAARDLDLNQVIVRDACKAQQPDVGGVLLDQVFPRFARIRSTEETIEMIHAGAA